MNIPLDEDFAVDISIEQAYRHCLYGGKKCRCRVDTHTHTARYDIATISIPKNRTHPFY